MVGGRWLAPGLVLLAVVVRLAALAVLDGDPLRVHRVASGGGLAWDWGYEQAAVAQAVARGEGFADPFLVPSGPTAWASPAYPLLLGGLIRAFGGITPGVAWCLAALQIVAASLTSWLLLRLGRDLHSVAVGLTAGLVWAVHPMAVYLPVQLVWDSTLVAMALTWFLASMIERGRGATLRALVPLGVGFGATLLVNPAPLALVPVIAWYYLRPRRAPLRTEPGGLARAAVLLGVAALTTAPWAARNAIVMGTPQLRSNLGVEFFVGNNDGAFGPFNGRIHPAYNRAEMERFLELGETAYSREAMGRARDWIEEHPARFARLSLERFQLFWFGPDPRRPIVLGTGFVQERDWMGWIKWFTHAAVALLAIAGALTWRGRPGSRTVVRGTLLFFPLLYYVTHVFERYRFPIEPMVTLAAAAFVVRLVSPRRP